MLPWLQRKERDSAYLSRLLLLAGQFVPPVGLPVIYAGGEQGR